MNLYVFALSLFGTSLSRAQVSREVRVVRICASFEPACNSNQICNPHSLGKRITAGLGNLAPDVDAGRVYSREIPLHQQAVTGMQDDIFQRISSQRFLQV